MTKPIEVVNFGETLGIEDLARAVYANVEPGFQIESVTEYEELKSILDMLGRVVPNESGRRRLGFNNAYSVATVNTKPDYAHIDTKFINLAVHQNITGTPPVQLAIANQGRYTKTPGYIDKAQAHNFRSGITTPGRLTVFSEGYTPEGQLPTVHLFDRRDWLGMIAWTRYATPDSYLHSLLDRVLFKGTAIRSLDAIRHLVAGS